MPAKIKINTRAFFLHSFYLSLTVLALWFWTNNPFLTSYNFYLAIFIIGSYLLAHFFRPWLFLDTIVYTASLLLIIAGTGGLNSSFFFLIYFLLFAVAILYEPFLTLILTLALTLFFANQLNSLHTAMQLLSLLFFSPLAIFFGKQYLRLLESQKKIRILAKKQTALKEEIEHEETDSLLWLSLNLKNGLLNIVHQASELMADNHLPLGKTARDSLRSIHETAKSLLKSGQKLQEKIDKETD
ncbi:MAG TPA: hypothetical protein VMW25_05695 [Clostridia bacterium]|nr:hypothetical protein [Clostridia bacterium]